MVIESWKIDGWNLNITIQPSSEPKLPCLSSNPEFSRVYFCEVDVFFVSSFSSQGFQLKKVGRHDMMIS